MSFSHLFKCWFVAGAPMGNDDSSFNSFIKIQWNKHSPHTLFFLICNLLTKGIVIASLMTAKATQQRYLSYPLMFLDGMWDKRIPRSPPSRKDTISISADTGNHLCNLGHGWDHCYGQKGSQQRSTPVLGGWHGPGEVEVLVPGPTAVLFASSKWDHHPAVSAFLPLLCQMYLFLSDVILPCVSTSPV